jgi:O-methyltransferase
VPSVRDKISTMASRIAVLKTQGKDLLRDVLDRRGYVIRQKLAPQYADFSPDMYALVERVTPYTQTPPERIAALVASVEYVVRKQIPGDVVECGVWRGGSMMAVASTLVKLGATDRELWLYDTYEGMTAPTVEDIDYSGASMYEIDQAARAAGEVGGTPPGTDISSVQSVIASTGYPAERLHFVKGPVEDTIPSEAPQRVALLRLDTDWYESTKHELMHLYPRLELGGVLILDDYGHFKGARKAVDEYFADDPILLARVDYGARVAVKLDAR